MPYNSNLLSSTIFTAFVLQDHNLMKQVMKIEEHSLIASTCFDLCQVKKFSSKNFCFARAPDI